MGSGGLWDVAQKYYPLFGAKAVQNPRPMFTFPSKAKVRFKQIANTQDSEKQRGLQFSSIMIDEITQLPQEAIIQLMACLRSEAKMNSFMCGTCNPHKNNWVFDLVRWYLDEEGYVDKAKNGIIRYFVTKDNSFVFADTEEWFKENMPETVMGHNPITGEDIYLPPKRFCFVQLTIFDNEILLRNNPRYLSELQNLPEHERAKQLYGNWFAEASGAKFFKRSYVRGENGEKVVDKLPDNCLKVIAWDKAATEFVPKANNTEADFTASIHMGKDPNGFFYIYMDACDVNYDEHEKVYGKFRKSAGARDAIMLAQAEYDGNETHIIIAQDSGGDGKTVYQDLSRKFLARGFIVKPAVSAVQAGKFRRFEPFLSACENGLVRIVESSFRDHRTLEAFYKELEQFAPTLENGKPWRSSKTRKDDFCDVVSDCFNYLNKTRAIPKFTLPSLGKTDEFKF